MQRVKVQPLLCAVVLAAIAGTPAAADHKKLSEQTASGWTISEWESTDALHLATCMIQTPKTTNGGSLAIEFAKQAAGAKPQGFLHLYNDSWQIGPSSAGAAVVELNKISRTLMFSRRSATEMTSKLPADDDSNTWLSGFATTEPINVRFPNNETFSVPGGGPTVTLAAFGCLLKVSTP